MYVNHEAAQFLLVSGCSVNACTAVKLQPGMFDVLLSNEESLSPISYISYP